MKWKEAKQTTTIPKQESTENLIQKFELMAKGNDEIKEASE